MGFLWFTYGFVGSSNGFVGFSYGFVGFSYGFIGLSDGFPGNRVKTRPRKPWKPPVFFIFSDPKTVFT